jgi:inhibitor of cysteine peptidase
LIHAAVGAIFLGLLAAAAAADPGPPRKEETHDKRLKVNEQMVIQLAENPSTGFQWQVDYDKNYLEYKGKQYQGRKPPPGSRVLVGAGGTSSFTFRALRRGETRVVLKYLQPWNPPPTRMVTYRVTIY